MRAIIPLLETPVVIIWPFTAISVSLIFMSWGHQGNRKWEPTSVGYDATLIFMSWGHQGNRKWEPTSVGYDDADDKMSTLSIAPHLRMPTSLSSPWTTVTWLITNGLLLHPCYLSRCLYVCIFTTIRSGLVFVVLVLVVLVAAVLFSCVGTSYCCPVLRSVSCK